MVKWLCVAEKPSIAKSITQILSGGQFTTRDATRPRWIKNYSFSYRMGPGGGHTDFTVTAVAGHLTENDFEDQYRKWYSCDPSQLFDARVLTHVAQNPDHLGIEQNLKNEARKATHLMIWTDCDREGEFIGSVVAEVCRKVKPNIVVKRARFSAIIPAQINQAARNPVDLDQRQAWAVQARMELDLRVGAVFTRVQTLELQNRVNAVAEKVVSYGPCQFPTLGFVVDQYERMQAFVPEPFWYIHVGLVREGETTSFSWRRGRLFDRDVAQAIFDIVEDDSEATVTRWETKPTQKWKPLPLTTVELQKSGSRLLRMTPKRILEIAETLYQRGILSYPRTETDQFDRDFNFHELIQKHTGDNAWGQFATNLLNNNGFERPRNGKKNDKAHPPIHPTAHVNNLAGEEKSVYDLIVRRFLACCSKNARGLQTTVEIAIAGESFSATGLVVRERNYLDVYPYDRWTGNHLPDFELGERFQPDELALREGITTQPALLTEADLVSLMDKNGIGTDATIAEHIAKIIEREYVFKQREGGIEYLVPSTLGIGLVKAYDSVGLENSLTKPHLRRLTEQRLVQICEGVKTKNDVVQQTLDEYRDVLFRTRQQMAAFVAAVRQYVEGPAGQGGGGGGGAGGGGGGGGGAGRGRRGGGPGTNDSDDDDPPGGGGRGGRGVGRGRGRGAREGAAERGRGAARGRGRGLGAAKGRAPSAKRKKEEAEDDFHFDDGADDGDEGPPLEAPSCNCPAPAAERTVAKEGPNKGRRFFGCAQGRDESYGFFAWADATGRAQIGPQSGGGGGPSGIVPKKRPLANASIHQAKRTSVAASTDELRCECDLTPTQYTSSKEGPNQGRAFFKCPNVSKNAQCRFFAWADELPGGDRVDTSSTGGGRSGHQAGVRAGGGGGGGRGGGSCFSCNEDGHWAHECPNSDRPGGGGGGGGGGERGGGAGGSGQRECFVCHGFGHWAKECPQRGAAGGGGGGGGQSGSGGSGYSCFKCGEQGHFSSTCTSDVGPSAPRKSGAGTRSRQGAQSGARKTGGGRSRAKKAASNEWD